MAFEAVPVVRDSIEQLFRVGTFASLSDAELLERFVAGPEALSDAAFTALVERHGALVRRVCLDLLGNPHDAQDVAQGAFLVLARHARSIRKPGSLEAWLHGVALRMARRFRSCAARRRAIELHKARFAAPEPAAAPTRDAEVLVALHQEIARLPEAYRNPIVLCHLHGYTQGYTQKEASERLGWPLGTLQSRLHRGCERLRDRLSRRGFRPDGARNALFPLLTPRAGSAWPGVEPAWTRATVDSAVRLAAGRSTGGIVSTWADRLLRKVPGARLGPSLVAPSFLKLILPLAVVGTGFALWGLFLGGTTDLDPGAPLAAPVQAAEPALPPFPVERLPRKTPDVDAAVSAGVRFLQQQQRQDGSWADADSEARTGTTSLATLALLAAGEPPNSPAVRRATEFLRPFAPEQLRSVYAVALQTMVFATVEPRRDLPLTTRNVRWLERAQIKPGDRVRWPGSWTYSQLKTRNGDNSNTGYALAGLNAAAEAGVPVSPEVWRLAGTYWRTAQRKDGGWGYTPDASTPSSCSMTSEAIASLLFVQDHRRAGRESFVGGAIRNCGEAIDNTSLRRGAGWLADHFHVTENFPSGQMWRFYYLDALEQVGALSGQRWLGRHDWFAEGAEVLLRSQLPETGAWQGAGPVEGQDLTVATSFALLFLGRGRVPLLIQKARHGPGDDWRNDPDDVRNLVRTVSRSGRQPLGWQAVDLGVAPLESLARAPILFLNGHLAPEINESAKQALRAYVQQGGFVLAEACCGRPEFDQGFRALAAELFPAPGSTLHLLAADHPVWTVYHKLKPGTPPLWGVEQGGRTVLIYAPNDLSCHWNLSDGPPGDPLAVQALHVGENVVAHALAGKAGQR